MNMLFPRWSMGLWQLIKIHTISTINNCNSTSISLPSQIGSHMDNDEEKDAEDHTRFRLLCIPISSQRFRSQYKKFQSQCYNFLERPCGVLSVSYHFAVFSLVVIGLVLAVLETMDEYKDDEELEFWIFILELFLLVLFGLEYALRMWSAGCRSTYCGILGRFRFACKPFVIVDLVVIGATTAVILKNTLSPKAKLSSALSILRFFQVLRMIRFDRQGGSWKLLGSVLFLHKQELMTTFYIGFCSLIFASFFVYQAEKDVNKAEFGTFADSFWWGVVTLTTVGYGDKIPTSWAGRGVAAFFAIMGISFFALPAGILGSGFALKVSQQQRQKHVKRRRRPAATLIQCNWRYFASRKESKLDATWLPYIRHIQEKQTRKDDFKELNHQPDKPPQNYVRTRKLSIFNRKPSGSSTEQTFMNTGLLDHAKVRRKKSNDLFLSFDSLNDGQSFPALDQRPDDTRPIILIDDCGKPSLPPAYKRGIRFTRYLKFLVALRKFKLAKKPYDVKDVIEQYNTGHVELLGKVKGISCKIDDAFGGTGDEKNGATSPNTRTNIVHRLCKLEKQVKSLDSKLDQVISLMEDTCTNDKLAARNTSKGKPLPCCVCGHATLQEKENGVVAGSQVADELKMPTRRRKVAMVVEPETPLSRPFEQTLKRQSSLPKNVSSLTAERLKQAMDENKTHRHISRSLSLKPELMKGYIAGFHLQRQKEFDPEKLNESNKKSITSDNYLSPQPISCGQFDLGRRRQSDSAIYSNISEEKKDDSDHSLGVTPITSSDSEEGLTPSAATEPKYEDNNLRFELTPNIVPYFDDSDINETRM